MHRIYTTKAIVIGSLLYGEADRFIIFYTREFGLVRAFAKSVRLEKSKLRYGLALYSLSEVSMVKGREIWRLTSVIHQKAYKDHAGSLKKILSVLMRLSGDEIHDSFLFDSLDNYFEYVTTVKGEDVKIAEAGIVLHILNRFGYLQSLSVLKDFLNTPFSKEKLPIVADHMDKAIDITNQALRDAHL